MSAADVLGAWCIASSLAFVWPQVWRVVRHDTTRGISVPATLHGTLGSVMWFSWGLQAAHPAVWTSNASFIVAQAIIGSVMCRHRRLRAATLAGFAAAAAGVLVVGLTAPPDTVGFAATFTSASAMVPTVVHVARAPSLHGISVLSWVMTVASAGSWMAYGFVLDDPMMTYTNYVSIPMMIFVISKTVRWRVSNRVPLLRAARAYVR